MTATIFTFFAKSCIFAILTARNLIANSTCYKYKNTIHLISRMAENTVFYGNLSCAAAELDVGDLLPKIACAEFKQGFRLVGDLL